MKASISDSQTLRLIDPDDLESYLSARKWSQLGPYGPFGAIYNRTKDGSDYELLVPRTRDIADFPQRISDILNTLAVVEGRSQIEILSDLTSTRSDVIRVRRPSADDGTLPLADGPSLVQSAYDMLLAAACSAMSPKLYYQGKRPVQATDYIGKARLGQSERGSYVLTVISPLQKNVKEDLFGKVIPFERHVTRLLSTGLSATVKAAEYTLRQANSDHFREAAADGVSANLLDAIVGLMGPSHQEVDIRFAWSPAFPIVEDVRPIEFDPEFVPVMQQASRFLKEQEPMPPVEIIGVVVALPRPEGFDQGRVTLLAFIDGRSRHVNLELPEDFYAMAITAHKERRPVRCRGELARMGRVTVLTNVSQFSVAPEIDDEESPAGPFFEQTE